MSTNDLVVDFDKTAESLSDDLPFPNLAGVSNLT